MGIGFAPTWLRQVSPPASQNHFNHWSRLQRSIGEDHLPLYCGGYNYDLTTIRLQSTALRSHDDLSHDRAAAPRLKSINRSAWLWLAGQRPVVRQC